jgi:hypothetical protein
LWSELVFLYVKYDEFDNAALAMMERSADAWEHNQFKEVVVKVANIEIYYKVCVPPFFPAGRCSSKSPIGFDSLPEGATNASE